jgi:hypothetical protein
MRYAMLVFAALLGSSSPAVAQLSIGIGLPHVSIGINIPLYPEFVRVPNYPVYYAPQLHSNYFFYDGMYWVYEQDNWYASSWYNGPWGMVRREYVPLFILRVPVRYYRHPPAYFHGWSYDEPPRWGQHWGNQWEQHRSGWNRWDHNSAPPPAPLPAYQRQYSGKYYPRAEQQPVIHDQNYHYQPRDPEVRQQYQEHEKHQQPQPPPKQHQQPQQQPQQSQQPPQQHQPQPQPQPQQNQQQSPKSGQNKDAQGNASPHDADADKAKGEDKDKGHEGDQKPVQGDPK